MRQSPRLLVVDDEPDMRTLLREGLESHGYSVSEAGDKEAMLRLLAAEAIDLVTLDLNLGNEDGLLIAREVRARRNVPIVMITARDTPDDRVAGLEYGADDYIVKPFRLREVVLRVESVLSRYQSLQALQPPPAAPSDRYHFDTGTLDIAKRELTGNDGTLIQLTESELLLLGVFVRHPMRVLSRDEITQLLGWRAWSPLNRALDVHIARLRKKIEPACAAPRLIKSVRGVGYIFTGEVAPP